MHDHAGRAGVDGGGKRVHILEPGLGSREAVALAQDLVAALFERHVVVVRHPVEAVDLEPFIEQQRREVKADESGGSGDEDAFHRPTATYSLNPADNASGRL